MGITVLGFTGLLWYKLTSESIRREVKEIRIVPDGQKVIFKDDFYVIRQNDEYQVFSAVCTHAGCRISQLSGEELVCSCHGSKYQLTTGRVTRGPALKNLEPVEFTTDKKTGEIIIQK